MRWKSQIYTAGWKGRDQVWISRIKSLKTHCNTHPLQSKS